MKRNYEAYLNEMGTPANDLKSNGGRISDYARYGSWMRKHDPLAFEIGLNEWKLNLENIIT